MYVEPPICQGSNFLAGIAIRLLQGVERKHMFIPGTTSLLYGLQNQTEKKKRVQRAYTITTKPSIKLMT